MRSPPSVVRLNHASVPGYVEEARGVGDFLAESKVALAFDLEALCSVFGAVFSDRKSWIVIPRGEFILKRGITQQVFETSLRGGENGGGCLGALVLHGHSPATVVDSVDGG